MKHPVGTSSLEQEFRQLQSFVNTLYPANLVLKVSPERQQQELETLCAGRRPEQFFLIVDFVNLTVLEAVGLEEIGYDSERFTFRQYLATIPSGSMRSLVTLLGKQTFLLSKQAVLGFLKPQFVANVPIICSDRRVMLTKRTISPWQFSESGLITAYVSEFVLLKPYEDEPLNPRFVHLDTAIETALNRMAATTFADLPKKTNLFSQAEISLLKLYAQTLSTELTASELADKAAVRPGTVRTHNKNILMKAKAMFGETLPVKTARDVAIFLKKCGLLG